MKQRTSTRVDRAITNGSITGELKQLEWSDDNAASDGGDSEIEIGLAMLGVSLSDDDILFEVRTDIRGLGCGDVTFGSGDSWTLGLDKDDILENGSANV
jgi:hypothetical protein